MSTKTLLPVSLQLSWAAPGEDFFLDPPENITAEAIKADIEAALLEKPGLEALADSLNLSGSIEVTVDGERVTDHLVYDEDLEGKGRFLLVVEVDGEMEANNGPGAMRSWGYAEIFDELYQHANVAGDEAQFEISVTRCR